MKYRTVVIDPPWNVGLTGGLLKDKRCLKDTKYYRCGKGMPYKKMSDSEVLAFPINDFASDVCDLFIWTTHRKLPIAMECLKQWGFKYHVLLTWNKTNGIGINGFHRKTELVVYGYRKKMGVLITPGHYIPTLFTEKLTKNSVKPNIFYAILRERTTKPRIDIFARKRHYGFDAYGDQVELSMEVPLQLFEKRQTVVRKES